MNTRKYWKMLAVCLVVMLLASFVSALVKTGAGSILVRETRINTRGGTLSGIMYIPKSALENDGHGNYTSPRPAVVLSHGYLNSNQMQDPNAIELSRRGFVVFSMDMYGHGNSDLPNATDDPTGTGATLGAIDAYEYMLTLPYVDHTRIGLAAHSMGGMNTGVTLWRWRQASSRWRTRCWRCSTVNWAQRLLPKTWRPRIRMRWPLD